MENEMLVYNFMFAGLPGSPTGLAMAVLNRTKGFVENGINSEILVTTFNKNHSRDMRLLREKGLLKVPVRYMFDDLCDNSESEIFSLPDPVNKLIKTENLQQVPDSNPLIKRLFDNGKYEYFVKYNSNGKINFIKHFSNQVFADKVAYYNDHNLLVSEEYYFPNSNIVLSRVYYNTNGQVFLRYLYKKSGQLFNIIHFPSGSTFKSEQELVFYWLSNILPKNEIIMLISEYAVYKQALLRVKDTLAKGSKLIFTLHNNHYASPYTVGSPIRNDFKTILDHLDEVKNVVVLTKEQRNDLISQFGRADSFFCVPHAAKQYKGIQNSKRKRNSITVGGRFEKIKGIEETIYAFKKVLKEVPEAHLNIIGRGRERDNYKKIIHSLGIEDNCSIVNFVSDLQAEYAKSDIAVFTSYYEGFHLSLTEAMGAGAVPITFPYKYGPKDIIDNGKSGIITKGRDIDELSRSIVEVLTNREKLSEMRIEAMKIPEKFSVKNNVKCWKNVFETAY